MSQCRFQPRGLARREAMIAAASQLFLEKGFEATSISDIVEQAGGSRRTLYEHFGNKNGLLRAIIEEATARVWAEMDIDWAGDRLTEQDLFQIAYHLYKGACTPEAVAVYRIVITEGHRDREISDLFQALGPNQVAAKLADWFSRAQAQGDFLGGDPFDMAHAFMGITMGRFHISYAIGCPLPWDEGDVVQHVRLAVQLFVQGARPPGPGKDLSV